MCRRLGHGGAESVDGRCQWPVGSWPPLIAHMARVLAQAHGNETTHGPERAAGADRACQRPIRPQTAERRWHAGLLSEQHDYITSD